jgi:hypothetical protein
LEGGSGAEINMSDFCTLLATDDQQRRQEQKTADTVAQGTCTLDEMATGGPCIVVANCIAPIWDALSASHMLWAPIR